MPSSYSLDTGSIMEAQDRARECGKQSLTLSSISKQKLFLGNEYILD